MIGHDRIEDKVLNEYPNFIGYTGDAPIDESSYTALIESQGVFDGSHPGWAEISIKIQNENARINRINEYPSANEYLDGIVKGDDDQVNKYIADCQAIKDKYPLEV
jgi:hypothetical protein